ncbi:DUF2934 domain-containing protein [Acidocella facilis]|uniref:DUF2934 domain-containing protein n=1 Tax=Acidocella facilis TaxID=525 RepID=UPI0009DE486E
MSDDRNDREKDIEQIAYHFWNDAGRPAGRDLEFWRQAEAEYSQRVSKQNQGHMVEKAGEDSFPASDPLNHM